MSGGSRSAVLLAALLASVSGCGREPKAQQPASATVASGSAAPERLVNHRLVPVGAAFERDLIELELAFGDRRSVEVGLVGPRARDVRLAVKDLSRSGFDVDVVPGPGGAESLRFRVRGERPGIFVGRVTLSTGIDDPPELGINYTWRVKGTLAVEPTNPYIDLSGSKTALIEVWSSQPDFAVRAAEVLEGPFDASFQRGAEPSHFEVRVTVRDGELADETRGVAGKILIVSNDLAEPKKELPLLAIGQVRR